MTIKAILDTNVIISGIFWKGAPFEILKAWQEHRFRLAITLPILNEYRRVLDEMTKTRRSPVLSSILEVIELYSEMVEPVSLAGTVCSDPDDDKFLEAAIAADADYVVSGDAALLRLKNHHRIQIVRPAQFLNYCPTSSKGLQAVDGYLHYQSFISPRSCKRFRNRVKRNGTAKSIKANGANVLPSRSRGGLSN